MIRTLRQLFLLCLLGLTQVAFAFAPDAYHNTSELDNIFSGIVLSTFANLDKPVQHYLHEAELNSPPITQTLMLQAVARAIALHDLHFANRLLRTIQSDPLTDEQHQWLQLLTAKLMIMKVQPTTAINYLQDIPSDAQPEILFVRNYIMSIAYEFSGDALASISGRINIAEQMPNQLKSINQLKIWQLANGLPSNKLHTALQATHSNIEQGWLELALVTQSHKLNGVALKSALTHWHARYQHHPANAYLPKILALTKRAKMHRNKTAPSQAFSKPATRSPSPRTTIALLLPTHGKLAEPAKHIQQGFFEAYYQFRSATLGKPKIRVYDTTLSATKAYALALRANPNIIVGPFSKTRLTKLYNKYHRNFPVMTLGLNYLPEQNETNPKFIQFGLSPRDEARQVAERASLDGHSSALIITTDKPWGLQVANTFEQNWARHGGKIIEHLRVHDDDSLSENIKNILSSYNELNENTYAVNNNDTEDESGHFEHRKDIDFIFLNVGPKLAKRIIPILKFNYSGDIPVYATSVVQNDDNQNIRDLDGTYILDMPWLIKNNHNAHATLSKIAQYDKQSIGQPGRLYAFGMDAFDIATQILLSHRIPDLGYSGKTGNLFLTDKNRVYRQLPWGRIVQDKIVAID